MRLILGDICNNLINKFKRPASTDVIQIVSEGAAGKKFVIALPAASKDSNERDNDDRSISYMYITV